MVETITSCVCLLHTENKNYRKLSSVWSNARSLKIRKFIGVCDNMGSSAEGRGPDYEIGAVHVKSNAACMHRIAWLIARRQGRICWASNTSNREESPPSNVFVSHTSWCFSFRKVTDLFPVCYRRGNGKQGTEEQSLQNVAAGLWRRWWFYLLYIHCAARHFRQVMRSWTMPNGW